MKTVCRLLAVAILFVSVAAFASGLDGVYKFTSRESAGAADMQGWWGMMVIDGNSVSRVYHSPDGKVEKFYVADLTKDGDIYKLKLKYTYKPEYVGQEHANKLTLTGAKLVMESTDGKFKETWTRK